jgi:hypothetical protein
MHIELRDFTTDRHVVEHKQDPDPMESLEG